MNVQHEVAVDQEDVGEEPAEAEREEVDWPRRNSMSHGSTKRDS